jgi:hypothetical protein
MRLTLRTLLAYLDDTLEPNQAKEIGQKVAESDTAQELIARIKQVTRRRRLTTPPDAGPGAKLDPNTIAGYLDNTLDADQLAEVEQTALASDVHLAEVATCHQILTLVLGEPALVPPTAKQRMYGLVKGREAIPFRKPPTAAAEAEEPPEGREVDETLRLGLPALRRKGGWTNWAILGGGATALVACLVLAIVMLLRSSGPDEPDGPGRAKGGGDAQAKTDKKKLDADKVARDATDKDRQPKDEKKGDGTDDAAKKDDGKPQNGGQPAKKPPLPLSGEPAASPPSPKVVEIGTYEPPAPPASAVLLQFHPAKDGGAWQRLVKQAKPARVWSGKPLVSLPTYSSTVLTDSGVSLTLWGTVPEAYFPRSPYFESLVVPHHSDQFDLDLTLKRGRIILTSTKGDRPRKVRLRFENTTDPRAREMWDIVLEQQGAKVLVDRWGHYPAGEPFYPNAKDPERAGPVSVVVLVVLNGSARVRAGDVTHDLQMPAGAPSPALLRWDSRQGAAQEVKLAALPEVTQPRQSLEKVAQALKADPKLAEDPERQKALLKQLETQRADLAALEKAARQLNSDLLTTPPESGLRKALESNEPGRRKLAVRAYGALDMLPQLVDALRDKQRQDVRQVAIETLMQWCASARDHDHRLLEELQTRYSPVESAKIMELMHRFSALALKRRETYDVLITQLTTPSTTLAIRELAAWHLAQLLPEAQADIQAAPNLTPDMLEQVRARLRQALKVRFPSGGDKGDGG